MSKELAQKPESYENEVRVLAPMPALLPNEQRLALPAA